MNKEQLWNHIQVIKTGLVALIQLPTTNRFNKLLKEKQSVKDVAAQISDLLVEAMLVLATGRNCVSGSRAG
jgi:hypothetical protein